MDHFKIHFFKTEGVQSGAKNPRLRMERASARAPPPTAHTKRQMLMGKSRNPPLTSRNTLTPETEGLAQSRRQQQTC